MKSLFNAVLIVLLLAATVSAQTYTKISRLGGATTRFTAPVHSIDDVKKASTDAYEKDVEAVLAKVGLSAIAGKVNEEIEDGRVTPAVLSRGATIEFMAFRNKGVPDVKYNLKWDGDSLVGYSFTVEDKGVRYMFFIPEVCGNLSLIKREAVQPVAVVPPTVVTVPGPTVTITKEVIKEVKVPVVVQAPPIEYPRPDYRYFVSGLVGKQQRQLDVHGEKHHGKVKMYGDVLVGGKLGVNAFLGDHAIVTIAGGGAYNPEINTRSSAFADSYLQYRMSQGTSFGGGVSAWDNLYHDNVDLRLGYLGTVTIPFPKEGAYKHLSATAEWREYTKPLYGRYTDPDKNYQFWGGLQINW